MSLRCVFVVLCWACLLPRQALATTARYVDLPNLVARADTVVLGEVVAREGFWQGPKIYTLSQLRVHQVWRGPVVDGAVLDVLTRGGAVGDLAQEVGGEARLPLHALMVLHLRRTSTGEYVPVAMAQGAWQVQQPQKETARTAGDGAQGAALLATLREEALAVVRPGVDRLVQSPGPLATPLPATLAELRQAVREAPNGPR